MNCPDVAHLLLSSEQALAVLGTLVLLWGDSGGTHRSTQAWLPEHVQLMEMLTPFLVLKTG